MKFNYKFEETSTDTRRFLIESEVELTEDEARLLSSEVPLSDEDVPKPISGNLSDWMAEKGNYKITYLGTEYGDDSQCDFEEVSK
jgi:hypothetical protein|tara:strand:+ start:72 stop:326 length:255 start_codon:yes stop_codon:yes gene_type:complete